MVPVYYSLCQGTTIEIIYFISVHTTSKVDFAWYEGLAMKNSNCDLINGQSYASRLVLSSCCSSEWTQDIEMALKYCHATVLN